MSESRDELIKRLFTEALEQPAEHRALFLHTACGDDLALHGMLARLLHAHDQNTFMREANEDEDSAAPPVEPPAQFVGPYRLIEVIGEGGFGTVWLAEQSVPVSRRVALKIIKPGMESGQVIARFDAERQALALMNHPNIARIFDVGTTQRGLPYFVMELVSGDPITQFCDANRLNIARRVELFAQVCLAVQHAHQKGVIHRDIKPTNVLVSLHDGQAVAKVIDFGVAKALYTPLTQRTLITELRQLIGTPQYMSPEQAAASVDIDTRSDVYSLGVLLYELLTGTTPFDPIALRNRAYDEIERVIREVDPPNPSTRLSTLRDALPSVAALRQVEPRKLNSLLRGELDWIVMKCLEKERGRRYESAAALAADVTRHLHDEPVSAGPPSATYRFAKFARRHKAVLATAAAIAVALAAGLALATWGFLEARKQRDQAEQRRLEAQQASQATKAVNSFLTDMLKSADPLEGVGKDVTVVSVLDSATKTLGDRFANRPLIEAEVRHTIGLTYENLGRSDLAAEQINAAYDLRRRVAGDDARETWSTENDLALVLTHRGENARAETLYRDALARSTRQRGGEDPETINIQENLALLLIDTARVADGREMIERVLKFRREHLGADHPDTITALMNLAYATAQAGSSAQAATLNREAAERSARVRGNDNLATMRIQQNLASTLDDLGEYQEGGGILRDLLAREQRVLPKDHPDTLATINALINNLADQDQYEPAAQMTRDLLDAMRRVHGPQSMETLLTESNLAFLLQKLGRFDEAVAQYHTTIDRARTALGDDHIVTMRARGNLATALRDSGRLDEAEAIFAADLPRWRKVHGPLHPETIVQIRGYGTTLEKANRLPEAEKVYAELFDASKSAEIGAAQTARNMSYLGLLRNKLGKFSDAEEPLAEAQMKLLAAGERDTSRYAAVSTALANVYDKLGKPSEAANLRAATMPTTRPATNP